MDPGLLRKRLRAPTLVVGIALTLVTPASHVVFAGSPDVDVSPTSISRVVSGIDTVPLTIRNLGDPTLVWSEDAPGLGSFTFLEQSYNSINGFNTGFYNAQLPPGGIYLADDVTPPIAVILTGIKAEGFMTGPGSETLVQLALAVTFKVYTDAADVPAGNPEAGSGGEVYGCVRTTTGPTSVGLTFSGLADPNAAFVTLDLVAAAGTGCPQPPSLNDAERYWVSVFPTIPGNLTSRRWALFLATTESGLVSHRISPTGINGFPPTWTPAIPATPGTLPSLALTLTGVPACGAPWLDLAPDGDSLGFGEQTNAIVTLDATGLAPGTYDASICIDTEGTDPDEPRVVVPVTMVVPAALMFADGFENPTP